MVPVGSYQYGTSWAMPLVSVWYPPDQQLAVGRAVSVWSSGDQEGARMATKRAQGRLLVCVWLNVKLGVARAPKSRCKSALEWGSKKRTRCGGGDGKEH